MEDRMEYQKYYVPESSKFPIFAAISLFILIIGASSTINSLDNLMLFKKKFLELQPL